jgi:Raf kinase inhibitor-like YbhB/YbcL family protein
MNKKHWFRVNVFSLVLVLTVWQVAVASEFTLTSPQMTENDQMALEQVYNGFGCSGKNTSPELHWANVPAGTKSLALTVYDPDAPTGSGWWHWVIFNIDPKVNSLTANAGDVRAPSGRRQAPSLYLYAVRSGCGKITAGRNGSRGHGRFFPESAYDSENPNDHAVHSHRITVQ